MLLLALNICCFRGASSCARLRWWLRAIVGIVALVVVVAVVRGCGCVAVAIVLWLRAIAVRSCGCGCDFGRGGAGPGQLNRSTKYVSESKSSGSQSVSHATSERTTVPEVRLEKRGLEW